jgi:molybdopterin converting factor small subunit
VQFKVQYAAQLRAAVGCSEEVLDLPEGSSLADLLRYVALKSSCDAVPFLLTPGGDVQPSLLIAVNNGAIQSDDASDVRINTGDVVMLMPPIAGG